MTRRVSVVLLLVIALALSAAMVSVVWADQSPAKAHRAEIGQASAHVVLLADGNATVYVTKTGKKYHCDGCRSLRKSKIAMSLKDAKAKGYTACRICNPPQ